MSEWFKWLRSKLKLSRLAFWRKPTPVAVPVAVPIAPIAKTTTTVDEKILEDYQMLYADFQAKFVRHIRDDTTMPLDDDPEAYARRKALYWKNLTQDDIAHIGNEWASEKRRYFSNISNISDYYTGQNGKAIKCPIL